MSEKKIKLNGGEWMYDSGSPLGPPGGFGEVFAGQNDDEFVAVKRLKLEASGAAHRELRIAQELVGGEFLHIMPIIDAGQDAESDHYFVVMPRAERSLQDALNEGKCWSGQEAAKLLLEIASGLAEVDSIVHRDLKPGNILYHDGVWKIADFGIARFVESVTSLRTLKQCLSPQYAAPEQWKGEHATPATDVYALGCIGYSLLTGHPPFQGPQKEDFQQQHLNESPPALGSDDPMLASLLIMMLRKPAASRPSLSRVMEILQRSLRASDLPNSRGGLQALGGAGESILREEAEKEARRAADAAMKQQRREIAHAGIEILDALIGRLSEKILESTPVARSVSQQGMSIELGQGKIEYTPHPLCPIAAEAFCESKWNVFAGALLLAIQSEPLFEWGASLWYGMPKGGGGARWWEISYMNSPFFSHSSECEPFGLSDPAEADGAMSIVMGPLQKAWGPVAIDDENEGDFFERWAYLLAKASQGNLQRPRSMPLTSWPSI